jgi:hypothetical protein
MRLIDADALHLGKFVEPRTEWHQGWNDALDAATTQAPTIDAIPVTEAELKHLINDTIAYIWRLEDRGCDKPEFGYDSRKALLEKLKQFYKEHFPDNGYCCGEQKDGEG